MIEVDDQLGAQKIQRLKLRRAVIWLAAVVLIGLMVGMMIGRLLNPLPAPDDHRLSWQVVELDQGFDLLIRAPGEVPFTRLEHAGAVSYRFDGVRVEQSPSLGRYHADGQTLGWRFENRETSVRLLLLSLKKPLQVTHSALAPLAGRAGVKLEVRFVDP